MFFADSIHYDEIDGREKNSSSLKIDSHRRIPGLGVFDEAMEIIVGCVDWLSRAHVADECVDGDRKSRQPFSSDQKSFFT
jgi:hypothetical protein